MQAPFTITTVATDLHGKVHPADDPPPTAGEPPRPLARALNTVTRIDGAPPADDAPVAKPLPRPDNVRHDRQRSGTTTLFPGRLAACTPSRRQFAWWRIREPALAGLADFDALVAETQDPTTSLEREDARLSALLRLAHHDETALVALMIVLAPRLRAKVRRFAPSLTREDADAEIIAGLIEQVRRYRLERRPTKIAANLLWDATRHLRRARDRDNAWKTATVRLNGTDTAAPDHGAVDLSEDTLIALAGDNGVLTPIDANLIAATKLRGVPLADAAALLGLTTTPPRSAANAASPPSPTTTASAPRPQTGDHHRHARY